MSYSTRFGDEIHPGSIGEKPHVSKHEKKEVKAIGEKEHLGLEEEVL